MKAYSPLFEAGTEDHSVVPMVPGFKAVPLPGFQPAPSKVKRCGKVARGAKWSMVRGPMVSLSTLLSLAASTKTFKV